MTQAHDERLKRLAQLLAKSELAADDPARRLAEALVPDDRYSHAQAEAELPLYVTDELLGRPAARLYPALHRHLLHCRQCRGLHAALLVDLAEEPAAVPVPTPDLSFLPVPDYWGRLRVAALRLAQAIAAALQPALAPRLAGLAELLFDELQDLGPDLWVAPPTGRAFAFAEGELSDEVRLLTAAWATTRQLGERLTPDQMAGLRRTGAWPATARQVAAQAAANLGFERAAADRFAQEYARLVASDPSLVPPRPQG